MIAFLLLLAFILYYFWINRRIYFLLWRIPSIDFYFTPKELYKIYHGDGNFFHNLTQRMFSYDLKTMKFFTGTRWMIVIQNPKDIEIILNSKNCLERSSFEKLAGLDEGSLFGYLEAWKRHHKILQPFFGTLSVKRLTPIFDEKVSNLIKSLKNKVNNESFDVCHEMSLQSLETILHMMGLEIDLHSNEDESSEMLEKFDEVKELVHTRFFKFWLHFDFIYERTQDFKKCEELYKFIPFKYAPMIKDKCRENQQMNEEEPATFVSALMDPKNNFTDKEIDDEIKTFIVAAQDTVAVATSSALLLLAMHKNTQSKLFNELHEAFPLKDSKIDFDVLNKLPYLEQVIKESLRIFPVTPFATRTADTEMQLSDCKIPEGIEILIPMIKIHKNPSLWCDNAHLFKPERFERKIHPYAYLPFAKGLRMCIGWKYAMNLLKINLAHLLLNFEFDTDLKFDELKFKFCVTVNVCGGYQVSIRERDVEREIRDEREICTMEKNLRFVDNINVTQEVKGR